MNNWGASHVSKGGRHTLIQATLTIFLFIIFPFFLLHPRSQIHKVQDFSLEGRHCQKGILLRWSIIQSSIDEGLEIFDIHERNISILAKWIWCFHQEKNALWRRIIATKFGSGLMTSSWVEFLCKLPRGHGSLFKICRIWFTIILKVELGGEPKLCFGRRFGWKHKVFNLNPFLYHQSLSKEVPIAYLWNQSAVSWNFSLRRNRNEVKIEE